MEKEVFFKPTPLYKEYMILDLIEKNSHITQRKISTSINTAVSLVNEYLESFEKNGYLKRDYQSSKTVEYIITKEGIERKQVLNIGFLKSSQTIYSSAKENISKFLEQVSEQGFKTILLYGAGEVAEIILNVISENEIVNLKAVAVIDDDTNKIGNKLVKLPIIKKEDIKHISHDGILISSYRHHDKIKDNLIAISYPVVRLIEFFK